MDSAWAAQPEPSSGPSRTPPAGSRPRHRHRSGSTTPPPRTRRPPPPRTAVPAQAQTGLAEKAEASELDADCPPAKVLSWALEHPCCGLRREGHGRCSASREKATSSAVPPAPMPPPRASSKKDEQHPCCGLRQEGQPDETPPAPGLATAPSVPLFRRLISMPFPSSLKDRLRACLHPSSRTNTPRCGLHLEGDRQHSGLCASPDSPPARRKDALAPSDWNEALRQGRFRRASSCTWAASSPGLLPQGRTPPPLRPPTGSEHPAGLQPEGPTPPRHATSRQKGRTRRHPSGSDQGHPSTASRAEPPHR